MGISFLHSQSVGTQGRVLPLFFLPNDSVFMNLTRFPRLFFAHLPTPLEPLPSLSKALGGPNIWMKRDDCTGLAGGGNKTRKLEFLMAEALQQKADIVLTQGATQSNHVRQTVAIATKLGLDSHVLLEDRTGRTDENHNHNGNVLLTKIFKATLERHPGGTDMAQALENAAARFQAEGKRPYLIPGGGSNPIGALGYVNGALELLHQSNGMNLTIDHIVHATGSTGTQAGLVAGLCAMNSTVPVLGIGVRLPQKEQEANVLKLARATAELLELPSPMEAQRVQANCDYVGKGYGIPAPNTLEAISLTAQHEGILLDPVYSGKGMAGLIGLIRLGVFKKDENVVFLHTGGAQALSGYVSDFA